MPRSSSLTGVWPTTQKFKPDKLKSVKLSFERWRPRHSALKLKDWWITLVGVSWINHRTCRGRGGGERSGGEGRRPRGRADGTRQVLCLSRWSVPSESPAEWVFRSDLVQQPITHRWVQSCESVPANSSDPRQALVRASDEVKWD